MNDFDYGVVIGVYEGIGNVDKILSQVAIQTYKPKQVIVWVNKNVKKNFNANELLKKYKGLQIIESSYNYGVYSRFTATYLLATNYAMVFDDDTIPGQLWAENCALTFNEVGNNAILGATGVTLQSDNYYNHIKCGNDTNTKKITKCDLVGHCWVFNRKLAKYILEDAPLSFTNGEDIHFSANAKIAEGINTYIPAQPNILPDTHGSLFPGLGNAPNRLSTINVNAHFNLRDGIIKYWINKGWKPLYAE